MLADELRPLQGDVDPVTGDRIQLLWTWDDVKSALASFLPRLTGPAWEYHDDSGNLVATPSTNPDWFRKYWYPEGQDNAAIAWTQADGTIKRVMCMTRENTEVLRINVTFGKLQDSNHLHDVWWDLGIRELKQYVHGVKQLTKLLERGDDDSVVWEHEPAARVSVVGQVYNIRLKLLTRPARRVSYDYHPGDPRWRSQ